MMRVLVAVLVLLGLQFIPGVGAGDARAACVHQSGNTWVNCSSAQEAYEKAAEAAAPYATAGFLAGYCPPPQTPARVHVVMTMGNKSAQGYVLTPSDCGPPVSLAFWVGDACPVGTTWDEVSHTCFDPAQCLAHNAEDGFKNVGIVTKPFSERCVGGCQYKAKPGAGIVHIDGADYDLVTGEFEFTGNACAAELPVEEPSNIQNPNPQECVNVPGSIGIPMCVKNSGDHCLVAPRTGKQFCWRPGEVGEKAGQEALQKRQAGTTAGTPTTPPPEGSTFVADPGTVTTQTTVGGNTIVTTFTNWHTDTGVEVAPGDQSEPADGLGGPAGDSDEPGSVVGGADCDQPPVVTGDPVLANVVLQTWGTRCAIESANSVASTGEIGVCSSPWTVDGPADDANVAKLKGIRAEICGPDVDGNGIGDAYEGQAPTLEEGIASGDTNSDGSGGGITAGQAFGEGVTADSANLDWTGWGYTRTCPTIAPITLMGGQTLLFSTDNLCDIMQTLGHLLLLLASLVSLRIMAGGIA